jgi:hypothetical protein
MIYVTSILEGVVNKLLFVLTFISPLPPEAGEFPGEFETIFSVLETALLQEIVFKTKGTTLTCKFYNGYIKL